MPSTAGTRAGTPVRIEFSCADGLIVVVSNKLARPGESATGRRTAVKAHLTRLMAKLDVTNRMQVAVLLHDAE